jgi:hypothetical protein
LTAECAPPQPKAGLAGKQRQPVAAQGRARAAVEKQAHCSGTSSHIIAQALRGLNVFQLTHSALEGVTNINTSSAASGCLHYVPAFP